MPKHKLHMSLTKLVLAQVRVQGGALVARQSATRYRVVKLASGYKVRRQHFSVKPISAHPMWQLRVGTKAEWRIAEFAQRFQRDGVLLSGELGLPPALRWVSFCPSLQSIVVA
jgi:hypothetical protein